MVKPSPRQRKLLEEYKKTLSLSQILFEIGIGTLLGDASIQTQNSGKTYRLKFSQSENKHREYLFHLHEMFSEWTLSPPFFHQKRQMWSFQTIAHQEFSRFAHIFRLDSNGTLCPKHIKPSFIENYMTPRVLAYWIMDDGGRSCYNKEYPRKGFVLNTQGFEKKDVEFLCLGLQNKYQLDCWTKPNKNGFVIVISGKNNQQMLDYITPFIIPSMQEKIPGLS